MKIPSTLVLLGEPLEVTSIEGYTWTFRKNAFYLATTERGSELWILPKPRASKKAVSEVPGAAFDMFKRFTGFEPGSAFCFTVSDFSPKKLGIAVSIAYRSNKWNGRSKGYIHHFENPTKIEVDNINRPGVWRLSGSKLKVRAVGITG